MDNAEHYRWGKSCDGWYLVKSEALSVIQERVPNGCSEVRHYHERSEQFFFILSGVATLDMEGVTYQVPSGHGLHIPAGKVHRLSNQCEEDLCFIVTSTPPAHGDRVEL